jgi:hypothetical protein
VSTTPGEAAYQAWLVSLEEWKASTTGNAEHFKQVANALDVFNALQKFVPDWNDLPREQQLKWENIAQAAIEQYEEDNPRMLDSYS